MISDMVLLRELPDSIKQSIEAYIACVSGAMRKNEYLQKIEGAGFQDIKVMGETAFSVEFIINDPVAKAMIEKSGLPPEKVEEMASSVVSIKIAGVKPPAKN